MSTQHNTKTQEILTRGVQEIIEESSVIDRLQQDKPLRVKFGIDPTGSDLHLGHTVNLWKLRQFQEAGHIAVVIIGDYTASIGDPSGKDKTRPTLSDKDIQQNYDKYEEQAKHILLDTNIEIRKQTEWFGDFSLKDIIRLTATTSVGSLLSHETFEQRLKQQQPFSAHEMLYPFLQGYDSVAVEADIELGAVEQKFNLLMGRTVQRAYGQPPQDVIMSPYLLGTDGKEKMSKSLGNYIGLMDEPYDMFGKVMSIVDEDIVPYYEMTTSIDYATVQEYRKQGTPTGVDARNMKTKLAYTITETFWGSKDAQDAQDKFFAVFKQGEVSQGASHKVMSQSVYDVVDLLVECEMASSKSDARRKIEQGSVYIDDVKVGDVTDEVSLSQQAKVIRVGKRHIMSLTCAP